MFEFFNEGGVVSVNTGFRGQLGVSYLVGGHYLGLHVPEERDWNLNVDGLDAGVLGWFMQAGIL